MKTWTSTVISDEDKELYSKIYNAVHLLPEDHIRLGIDKNGAGIILSCHIFCYALQKMFGVRVVDGFFYPNCEHSWLTTASGNIIDVYPPGVMGGPLLWSGDYSSAKFLYKRDDKVLVEVKKKIGEAQFNRAVNEVFNNLVF